MEVRYQSELKWNLQENHFFYVPTTTLIIPLFCVMSLEEKVASSITEKSGQTILV